MSARTGRALAAAVIYSLATGPAASFDFPNVRRAFGLFGGSEAKPEETAPVKPPSDSALECPDIIIANGASALRVPPDAGGADVRYQLSLGALSRECSMKGDDIVVKLGIEGAAVLGPSGQPGSYSGALRVAVRRVKDEAILQSKVYRVAVAVPQGATRAEFRLLADPLSMPYLSEHPANDYEILVGFEGSGIAAEKTRRKTR